jgi:hypothetical protein
MRTHLHRRVALGALVLLTTLTVVAPVEARSPVRKIEPRRAVPYRVGHTFTPNTDVLSESGYAAWMIDELLGSTTPLPELGSAFLRVEREQGINARFFVAHAMLESGWGTSPIARYKRNLFGYGAYDRDPWRYATRFPSHAKGVAAVAEILRDSYLTPGGRWWYRFTTPRAINRYYASDPRWADKVAHLANVIDALVVTLRERWVRFRRPSLAEPPIAGAPVTVEIPWRAKPGAQIPAALRFAVRWIPVAVVEASAEVPAEAPGAPWRFAERTDDPGKPVRLEVTPPELPGLWRLEVQARDSDGRPLPETDRPPIPSLEVRVAAPDQVGVSLSIGDDGSVAATVTVAGPVPAPVDADETDEADGPDAPADVTPAPTPADVAPANPIAGATLEVWALPLDAAVDPQRVAAMPLPDTLGPGAPWTVSVGAPEVPAVVVARIAGGAGSASRGAPVAVLTGLDPDGRITLTPLRIAVPRDDLLLGRTAAPAPVTLRALEEAGSIEAETAPVDLSDLSPSVGAREGTLGRPSLLVRSVAVEAGAEAAPTSARVGLTGWPAAVRVAVTEVPAGVRLVVAGLVPADGHLVDVGTLSLAWIAVAGASRTRVAPH